MTPEKFNKLQSKAWVLVMEHLKYLDSEEKGSASCKDRISSITEVDRIETAETLFSEAALFQCMADELCNAAIRREKIEKEKQNDSLQS
ncbi:hypothetical protein HMPREF9624_00218 [Oribacterium asaccharolyticum ACB7]|uniref:Uncharacterized protein n=1 Tax=Oribacterium asaccharolyticum ACB7 TaxID=796944 RepID=G9WTI4_9FIRM|nr:hypothetical protein HMPREF9624_00218 [Oribacterium asaccharolyticum ACB7]